MLSQPILFPPFSDLLSCNQVRRHIRVQDLVSEYKAGHAPKHQHRRNQKRQVLHPRELQRLQHTRDVLYLLARRDVNLHHDLCLVRIRVRLHYSLVIVLKSLFAGLVVFNHLVDGLRLVVSHQRVTIEKSPHNVINQNGFLLLEH